MQEVQALTEEVHAMQESSRNASKFSWPYMVIAVAIFLAGLFIGQIVATNAMAARIQKLEAKVQSMSDSVNVAQGSLSVVTNLVSGLKSSAQTASRHTNMFDGDIAREETPDAVETTAPLEKIVPAPAVTTADTVYITRTGKKYHAAGCGSLSRSCIPISRQDAVAKGYGPCSRCNP